LAFFTPFQISNPNIFVIFGFSQKNKNFPQVKLTFVSPKKILGSYLKYSQNAGLILGGGGGVKWTLFPPSPKK
jgi:hypothetical protein